MTLCLHQLLDDRIRVLLRRRLATEVTGDRLALRDRLRQTSVHRMGNYKQSGTYGESGTLNLVGVLVKVHVPASRVNFTARCCI